MNRKEFLSTAGLGILGGAAMLSGCSKLLDQANPNNLTPNNFWKTSNDAKTGVTAVYNAVNQQGFVHWHSNIVPGLYRGDDVGITHDVPAWFQLALFNIISSNVVVENMWTDTYTIVFRANQVIEHVPNISMDKSLRKRYIGEAKFCRAFAYFKLLTNYLNVPLILKPQVDGKYNMAQSPPVKVWGQIEKDLNDAVDALPATYNQANKGRVTKGAALGYLGQSYLYQKKWSKAAATFEQIISTHNYVLLPNYRSIFLTTNEFNDETLFEVSFDVNFHSGAQPYTPRNREESVAEVGGWYECWPNQWLFDEMSKEKTTNGKLDPRLYHTIMFKGSGMTYYGRKYEEFMGPDKTDRSMMKYSGADELTGDIEVYSSRNDRVMRYSDILLMHAEALVRSKNGTLSDAKKNINKVRNRAHLSNLPTSMSKTQVLREIEHQRICELADEANRWYDLMRWGGSIDGSMTIKENLKQHGAIGADNFDPNKHKIFPIPLTEMQTNSKIKQNPGY
jgi:hypothetical protein